MGKRTWKAGDILVRVLTDDAWTSCYIVKDEASEQAFVVDPYWINPPLDELRTLGVAPPSITVLVTHPHPDHLDGIYELREAGYNITAIAHKRIADILNALLTEEGIDAVCRQYNVGLFRSEIESMAASMEGVEVEAVADGPFCRADLGKGTTYCFEGHSPADSVILFPDGHGLAFTGDLVAIMDSDVLFGRTDFPGGNRGSLTDAIGKTLAILPDNCLVCPGHGEPFELTCSTREMITERLESS